jgi:eukaryotic-like serine/threonine-protein kinase
LPKESLEDLLVRGALGADREALAVVVLRAISLGLGYAHEQGFVHRDVTPRNILAFPAETPGSRTWVIGDWGLVKRVPGETTDRLTNTGEGLGTEGFAAPESWDDAHKADPRADVYSLGRVAAWLVTGRWPAPNLPLLPEGPLRGLVFECTEPDPDRRLGSMDELRSRLDTLIAQPTFSPRGEVQALVERAISEDAPVEAEIARIARAHRDNEELFLDELARLPVEHVERLAHEMPDVAADLAATMVEHLVSADWGERDFNYANVPLGWAFEVLRVLTEDGRAGAAEDLGVAFFRADEQWNRFKQHGITLRWLRSLREEEGAMVARALRRAGTHDYYRRGLARAGLGSRSLAAEFGQ